MSGSQNINYSAAGYELDLLMNPSSNSDYTNIVSMVDEDDRSAFNSSYTNAETASNGLITNGRMLGRNMSLSNVATTLTNSNVSHENEIKKERDTYTRQGEINEWQAQNKLDTLFFLQILFIFFGLVIALMFLRQAGILNGVSANIVIGVLFIIVIGVLWNRASYTARSRDSRYWNRRFIGLNDSNLSASSQCAP